MVKPTGLASRHALYPYVGIPSTTHFKNYQSTNLMAPVSINTFILYYILQMDWQCDSQMFFYKQIDLLIQLKILLINIIMNVCALKTASDLDDDDWCFMVG